ncbi:oxidative stress defense protein [Massilia terrae]|uniref:SIMPL domain-containing protein n=1 Tax=Massilia terrae TaxID=1811224 RepID=A0ABT2CSP5_9BURK|nr:SIMPL domain-containing protein [Massilia terrae]MCS0656999.1 SIMPL domain-containing protein [Massilia terrae]
MLKKSILLLAFLFVPLAASASQLPEYPFIHITGSAMQFVPPDLGELDFEIVATNADPAQARATVDERIAQIQALVQEQGLPAEDVMLRDVRQSIKEGSQVYDVRCSVHLNVRDLSKWQAIAGGLVGMENLDNFATDFAPADKEQVEMELTNAAIKDARKHAEAMAAGFGRKLGPVTGVSTGALKNLSNAMGLFASDFTNRSRAGSPKRMEKPNIASVAALRFAVQVDVIFRIK